MLQIGISYLESGGVETYINTLSLLLANEEITLLESRRNCGNVHNWKCTSEVACWDEIGRDTVGLLLCVVDEGKLIHDSRVI
jgi:hypothetical protein